MRSFDEKPIHPGRASAGTRTTRTVSSPSANALTFVRSGVRVIVRAKLTKFVAKSGRYHIYRRGSSAPCFVRVLPNHKGFAVRAMLQVLTNGRWRKAASKPFRLNASSAAGFAIRGTPNANFRVHVSMSAHHDHLGDTSPWLYLRFR